jgi:hypothetical protein
LNHEHVKEAHPTYPLADSTVFLLEPLRQSTRAKYQHHLPTIPLSSVQQHTLGFPKAGWFKSGLRSIEAGTRARAALLNITKEGMRSNTGKN